MERGLQRLNVKYKVKNVDGMLWIRVAGSLHGLQFDTIRYHKDLDGYTLIAIALGDVTLFVFNAKDLKGKLRGSSDKQGRLTYDLF